MAHVRQQIRDYVMTLLNGNVAEVSQWHTQRRLPLPVDVTGMGLIYTDAESSEPITAQPVRLERQLSLNVQGRLKSSSATIDDTADDFAEKVEQLLCADLTLGGLSKDLYLRGTQIEADDKGEQSLLLITLQFVVSYHTTDSIPQTAI